MPNMSAAEIKHAIERLRDPRIKYKVNLASSAEVAKDIVDSLPGVKELKEAGPQAAKAVLELLQDEETLADSNLTTISLRILKSYPSEEVKLALAKPISERRFRGLNSEFAAETFLTAAQLAIDENPVPIALEEAIRLQSESHLNITAAEESGLKPSSKSVPKEPSLSEKKDHAKSVNVMNLKKSKTSKGGSGKSGPMTQT
jgi:hypothetical protein